MSEVSVVEAAVAVVGDARQALTALRDTEFWKVPDADLLLVARDLEALGRLVFTAQVHLAGEVDTRRLAGTHGAASTAALLRTTLGVSHSDAASMVRTAAAVLPQKIPSGGELPPVLPLLAEALEEGAIGADQTRTVVTTMTKLPARVDEDTRLLCQQQLVANGRITEPAPFAVFARAVLIALDEGQDFDDDPPADHVEFSLGTRNPNTGLTRVSGQLDDLGVEIVNQAIGGLSAPVGPNAGAADPRPAATRRGHALLEVLRRYLDLGDAPMQGGERPHITVTMTLDDLRAATGDGRAPRTGGMGLLDFGGPITAAQARTLACDAMIVPAVLGSPSQVLDVGSASRLFPIAIRRALVLRDKGCAFPGCDRPPAWTDAHHVIFGQTRVKPATATDACCAGIITARSTGATGTSGSPTTAFPSSCHRRGSTPHGPRGGTRHTTSRGFSAVSGASGLNTPSWHRLAPRCLNLHCLISALPVPRCLAPHCLRSCQPSWGCESPRREHRDRSTGRRS